MYRFYVDHVFGSIDEDKWIRNEPKHITVEQDGQIIAGLTYIKRESIDHIWLCGVIPELRGKGYFAQLISRFREVCTEFITVATYPYKWNDMFFWIVKKEGILIKMEDDGKCLFMIKRAAL